MKEQSVREISEHIVEIRYPPSVRILDHRGQWADEIAALMALPQWKISVDRADVHDAENREGCFITLGNAGYVVNNPTTANEFSERATKFIRFVLERSGFAKPLRIMRLGVRSRFCYEVHEPFDRLLERFQARYMCLMPEAKKAIDAKLVGIGAPLDFADDEGHFNTGCGPMLKQQIKELFPNAKDVDLPNVGLYYDVDYWKSEVELDDKQILRLIVRFAQKARSRWAQTIELILKD